MPDFNQITLSTATSPTIQPVVLYAGWNTPWYERGRQGGQIPQRRTLTGVIAIAGSNYPAKYVWTINEAAIDLANLASFEALWARQQATASTVIAFQDEFERVPRSEALLNGRTIVSTITTNGQQRSHIATSVFLIYDEAKDKKKLTADKYSLSFIAQEL